MTTKSTIGIRRLIQPQLDGTSNEQPRAKATLSTQWKRPAAIRAYFRNLRAAEMAAWEMTGGDYVVSAAFIRA